VFSIHKIIRQGSVQRGNVKRGSVGAAYWWASAVLGLGLMVLAPGCSHIENIHDSKPESLAPQALTTDQAMQARIWDRTTATYENGSVVAGGTLMPYRPADNLPWWGYVPLEMGLFYGQIFAMPVQAFIEPHPATYPGVVIEPMYNKVEPAQPAPAVQ
jgi:hypothetical protein